MQLVPIQKIQLSGKLNVIRMMNCDKSLLMPSYPQAKKIGLVVPDKNLKWDKKRNNGAGGYAYGKIDWDEFWRVIKGDGPMNNERLSAKKRAWDEGNWVREAARAHALKKQTALQAAE